MKHLFSYIVFLFLFFNTITGYARTISLPDDFHGVSTRKILQKFEDDEDEEKIMGLVDQFVVTYEVGLYAYQKYTPEEIAKRSFNKKLRPFFPNYNSDQLDGRRKLIYNLIGAYQYGKQKYTDIVNKFLVPHSIKKVRSDADYDHPNEVPYMEAAEGEFIKVYNFKKFLTYSENIEERAAIAAYETQKNKDNVLEQFNEAMQKIEWKKVFLYGIKYDNPLYSENGITPIQQTDTLMMRLVSDGAFIDKRNEFKIGILVVVEPHKFVLANNLNFQWRKPQINLKQSQNIEADYQVLYPVPVHSQLHPEVYKYTGNFMIMANIKPIDVEKEVIIHAETDITECDYNLNCVPQHFVFEQKIEPQGTDLFGNGMENYFFRTMSSLPQETPKNLTLKEFTVHNDSTGQSLFLEFYTRKSINTFNIFIEENDAETTFKEPLVSLRDGTIFVRIEPTEEYADRDLSNAEYTITASLNNKEFLRQKLVPQKSSLPNLPTSNFGLKFFIFAFIGGLLLNLMPCVLPLWTYKLQSMFILHKKSAAIIRTDIKQVLASLLSVAVVALMILLMVKHRYTPFVWGIQLQNMPYIMFMLFGGIVCMKILPNILENILPENMRFLNYVLGVVGGIAAISCGAPYLSDAYTAAANENNIVLCLTYAVVLCGFCLPFIFLLKTKNPQNFLMFIHQNHASVNIITKFSLCLAYAWYLLLIYWQTGFHYTAKIFLATLILLYITDIFLKFLQYLDGVHDENVTLKHIANIKRGSYITLTVLLLVCVTIAGISAFHRQVKHRRQNAVDLATSVSFEQIENEIKHGNSVLVTIDTDWCFTCRLNEMLTLNKPNFNRWAQQYHMKHIRLNQTSFDRNITEYMKQYTGNINVPFYVLYTPIIRNGIVLPDRPTMESIDRLLIYNKRRY